MTQYVYQDTSSLVKWLRISMLMWFGAAVLMLLVEFVYSTVIYHSTGFAEGDVVYRWGGPGLWEIVVITFFPVVKILISLQWMVFMLIWVHRAHSNNWALGLKSLIYTPMMAVLWFIIPILNVFFPFVALTELFKASDPDTDTPNSSLGWQMAATPAMLPTWWIGWLLISPLAMPPFVLGWIFGSMGQLPLRMVELAVYLFQVVLMFMFWKLAKDHREMQERKYELMFGAVEG